MDKIEELTLQQVIDNQERVIKEQKEDIERLQAQLDREIKINRKMKRTLEKYAFENTKMKVFVNDRFKEMEVPYANDTSLALQVLKEIDNKE